MPPPDAPPLLHAYCSSSAKKLLLYEPLLFELKIFPLCESLTPAGVQNPDFSGAEPQSRTALNRRRAELTFCSLPKPVKERNEHSVVHHERQSPDPKISPAGKERNEHSVVYQNPSKSGVNIL